MQINKLTDLINLEHVQLLISIFKKNNAEIRLVGGCIRDALIEREIKDIDTATILEPQDVLFLLKENNIEYDDFAIQYGSIIAYPHNRKVQITTLREDINQMGRHTNVIYTKSWKKDSARRDFTFNALYVGDNNKLYDYYGGLSDLEENKISFIGEIEDRIKEDYLRIYRYFRFRGLFNLPKTALSDQKIVEKYIHESLAVLTNDVIRQEILKMFNMSFPLNCFYVSHQTLQKFKWIEIIKEHFIRTNYELGLNKCLDRIDNLIN